MIGICVTFLIIFYIFSNTIQCLYITKFASFSVSYMKFISYFLNNLIPIHLKPYLSYSITSSILQFKT